MQDKTPKAVHLANFLRDTVSENIQSLIAQLDNTHPVHVRGTVSTDQMTHDALELLATWDFYEDQPDTPQRRLERDITRAIAEQILRNARA